MEIFALPAGDAGPAIADRTAANRTALLQNRAQALETAFLAEMLAHSGLGGQDHPFDGGIGEQQFASLLRYEQARMVVKRGGIGLAEQLFEVLAGKDAAQDIAADARR